MIGWLQRPYAWLQQIPLTNPPHWWALNRYLKMYLLNVKPKKLDTSDYQILKTKHPSFVLECTTRTPSSGEKEKKFASHILQLHFLWPNLLYLLLEDFFHPHSEILLTLETICWQMILRLLDFLWTICKSYFCGTGTIQKELMTSAVVAYSRSWASTGTQSCAVHSCLCNCLQMCQMQMQRN